VIRIPDTTMLAASRFPANHPASYTVSALMTPLVEWQTFYQIVGSAAGALTGLQFVAMALIADMPTQPGEQAAEAFASPTIVHFVAVLLLSASLTMPWHSLALAAVVWELAGFGGLVYLVLAVRRMRTQTIYQPVFEDWLFHAVLPFVAYVGLTASAFATRSHSRGALFGIAGAVLLLLVIGIHNSWDNLIYLVFVRRREMNPLPKDPGS
jgi:hypothetical protein